MIAVEISVIVHSTMVGRGGLNPTTKTGFADPDNCPQTRPLSSKSRRSNPFQSAPAFWPWDTDTLATDCPLYNVSWENANPGSRAGDFQHEGWHGWLNKYNWDNGSCGGHRCGPLGNCSASGCDYFYFHGIGAYAFGALYQTDGTANRFHSPNQVQVEFLCDVAQYPQWWVPASVQTAAQSDADTRAAERFINGPGYSCGDPRPW